MMELHQSNGAHMVIFLRILAKDVTMETVKFLSDKTMSE